MNTTVQELSGMIRKADDPLPVLAHMLAPHVEGLERAKQAVVLSLVSLDDKGPHRGRIHTLLHGPPGTGKGQPLKRAAELAKVPVFSPRTTEAGLTADLRDGAPGALPRMGNTQLGVFALDELDKLGAQQRQHMLQAMEGGKFTVVGGGVQETHQAPVRVIAAANRIEHFSPEFLDRFDLKVHVPRPDQDAAQAIVSAIAGSYMSEGGTPGVSVLAHYIRSARAYRPAFGDQTRARASKLINGRIEAQPDAEVSIRDQISVLRIALALARIEFSPVEVKHVRRAMALLEG